jgi:uncharacterized RDD family membrane protein YckC/DNA-directed RNA polymerase subunit RPC12/RpoP
MIEYRCSRCWHSNCADINAVATQVSCRNCGHANVVPEATPERIERAMALLESSPEIYTSGNVPSGQAIDFDHTYSDQEIQEIARRESYLPLSQMNFQGYPKASNLSRLFANIIDNLLFGVSMVVGVILAIWIGKRVMGIADPITELRLSETPPLELLVLMLTPLALFSIGQWYLMATSGQSMGKKLMMIRIVTDDGAVPGFVRAVLLRSWVCLFLCGIPVVGRWLGFIDILFIFSSSGKCLHDHIAGTRVVTLM